MTYHGYRLHVTHGLNISEGKRAAEIKKKEAKLAKLNLDEGFWKRLAAQPKSQQDFIRDYLTQPVSWACLEDKYNMSCSLMQNHFRRIMRKICY